MRIALIGSGAGTTADAICRDAEANPGLEIVLIIGNNSGAGISQVAQRHGVPFLHLSTHTHPDDRDRDRAMRDELERAEAELVVLAGYMKKVGPITLEAFEGRIINTHPALLPKFGGAGLYGDRVHAAVLEAGETTSGASVHLVTDEYDEGPVLGQREVPVLADDTVETLRARVQAAEKQILTEVIAKLAT